MRERLGDGQYEARSNPLASGVNDMHAHGIDLGLKLMVGIGSIKKRLYLA